MNKLVPTKPCKIIGFDEKLGYDDVMNKKAECDTHDDFLSSDLFKEACATAAKNLGTDMGKFLNKRQAGKFLHNSGIVYLEYVRSEALKA